MQTIEPSDRISVGEAAAILGIPRWKLTALGRKGEISSFKIPGCRPLYSRSELTRIAATATRPGRSAVAAPV